MKKGILSIFLIFFVASAFSQKGTEINSSSLQKSILIVPLKNKSIHIGSKPKKIIKYNNVSLDSCIKTIYTQIIQAVKKELSDYNIHILGVDDTLQNFSDSLRYLKKWNSFNLKRIKESEGIKKLYYRNENSNRFLYWGCDISPADIAKLNEMKNFFNYDFVIFINRFEIRADVFSVHCDLFNDKLIKIYGDKNEFEAKLGKEMYYDVLIHFSKEACRRMFKYMKNNHL